MSLYIDSVYQQTYNLLPTSSHFTETLASVPQRFVNITYEHLLGEALCQLNNTGQERSTRRIYRTSSTQRVSVSRLSTCKWIYIRNIDPNRKPEVLIEAECACSSPANVRHQSCYPVTQHVMVFRRTRCVLGTYVYERIWEPVRVACVAGVRIRRTIQRRRIMPE